MKVNFIILAAGKGSRLKLKTPKPLVSLLGQSMLGYVLETIQNLTQREELQAQVSVVISPEHREQFATALAPYQKKFAGIHLLEQARPLGTAHAVQCGFEQKKALLLQSPWTFILCGDTPCLPAEVLQKLYRETLEKDVCAQTASFILPTPEGYGRIQREGQGIRIIEEKDASVEERQITEVNSGLYCIKTSYLASQITQVTTNNQAGEFYLTDIFTPQVACDALLFAEESNFLGVNTPQQLTAAQDILLARKRVQLQNQGVRFLTPATVYLDWQVQVGSGCLLHSQVTLLGNTRLEDDVTLEQGCVLRDTTVASGTLIKAYSYLESARVGADCSLGPFARLRPGSVLEEQVKVGNFVEIKKSHLHRGAKASHLSYIGDAQVGEDTNIGCGFVTCNYDGVNKHPTIIGKNVFIGSSSQAVAPVKIGDDSIVAAGTTLCSDVPENALAIARTPQQNKEGLSEKIWQKKRKKD